MWRTRRLRLDALGLQDLPEIQAIALRPDVARWLFDPTQAERMWPGADTKAAMAIRLSTCGALLGGVSIDAGGLSYFVHPDFQGNGYASEALAGFCGYVRQNSPGARLRAEVQRTNLASIAVLERTGFRFAGLVRAHGHRNLPALAYLADATVVTTGVSAGASAPSREAAC